jgi:hypothetical protein
MCAPLRGIAVDIIWFDLKTGERKDDLRWRYRHIEVHLENMIFMEHLFFPHIVKAVAGISTCSWGHRIEASV